MSESEDSQIHMSTAEFVKLVQKPLFDAITRLESSLKELRTNFEGSIITLQAEVAELRSWRSNMDASKAVHVQRDNHILTKRQRIWTVVYAIASLSIFAFIGPFVSHLLAGH